MKVQVSVDMAIGESGTVEGVYMPITEYERLKRLEENVKKKIAETKYLSLGKVDQTFYEDLVKLLESLDK